MDLLRIAELWAWRRLTESTQADGARVAGMTRSAKSTLQAHGVAIRYRGTEVAQVYLSLIGHPIRRQLWLRASIANLRTLRATASAQPQPAVVAPNRQQTSARSGPTNERD